LATKLGWAGQESSSSSSTNLGDEAGLGWGSTNLGDEAGLGWAEEQQQQHEFWRRSWAGLDRRAAAARIPATKLGWAGLGQQQHESWRRSWSWLGWGSSSTNLGESWRILATKLGWAQKLSREEKPKGDDAVRE
jgi:hypothetical protein